MFEAVIGFIEPVLAFFEGDELLAIACVLPLSVALIMAVLKTMGQFTARLFGSGQTRTEQYVDTEYHKENTSELFVAPTQIDTPY